MKRFLEWFRHALFHPVSNQLLQKLTATAFPTIKSQRFAGQLGREWYEQFRLCRKVRSRKESYFL